MYDMNTLWPSSIYLDTHRRNVDTWIRACLDVLPCLLGEYQRLRLYTESRSQFSLLLFWVWLNTCKLHTLPSIGLMVDKVHSTGTVYSLCRAQGVY